MKKKIIIITNLYPSSWEPNRATFNKQQFNFLSKHIDVSVLVPVAWPQWLKLSSQQKKEGSEAQTVKSRFCWYFYTPKFMRRFYSFFMLASLLINSFFWIRKQKSDFIMASWAYPEGVATAWLATLFNKPFFLKVHGSDINDYANDKARAKQIVKACERAQGIFSVSQALKNKLVELGVNSEKIHVIYNGVDKSVFYADKSAKSSQSLLFVGNLKANKGVSELIESFITLKKTHQALKLVIAGDGAMMPIIVTRLTEEGLLSEVELLGNVAHHQIPALLRASSLLVLPSYAEGVPNVILEAFSCGTPVVATAVGGIPEVVSESDGILVKKQSVENLTQGINKALAIDWNSERIKEKANEFSWDDNARKVFDVIQNNG